MFQGATEGYVNGRLHLLRSNYCSRAVRRIRCARYCRVTAGLLESQSIAAVYMSYVVYDQ
jgi:hypothetical protein